MYCVLACWAWFYKLIDTGLQYITMHKWKKFECICSCDWSGSPLYRYLLQASDEIHVHKLLHPVADQAQSFAVESTYTGLTDKSRAGPGSAAWGKLISAGPSFQPRCQHVLCIGLLGLVSQTKRYRATLHNHAQVDKV